MYMKTTNLPPVAIPLSPNGFRGPPHLSALGNSSRSSATLYAIVDDRLAKVLLVDDQQKQVTPSRLSHNLPRIPG